MQESIRFLAPIVVGFFFVHALLIVFGIASETGRFVGMLDNANASIRSVSVQSGWTFVAAIFLRAYALGGSTYSGVESMSNHVNLLAEPRLKTGRMAMLSCCSISLESVQPVHGQTLNAIAFSAIIGKLGLDNAISQGLLVLTLALEGAILLVAANSILIFAPALLGNMASDSWLPHRLRNLSSRLVREDGVIFIGACAVAILLWTPGELGLLVVFYSINVFLCLTLSKLGLWRYWWKRRAELRLRHLVVRLSIAVAGLTVAVLVLVVTLKEKLFEQVRALFPNSVCFSNKLILPANRWFSEWLHNQTALSLQRQLHFEGIPLVIFPIKLGDLNGSAQHFHEAYPLAS